MLGMKMIEQGDRHQLIRFPFWISESMMRQAGENLRKDAALQGRELEITVGHRMMRIEGDVKPGNGQTPPRPEPDQLGPAP
jgi:hypothetical protein